MQYPAQDCNKTINGSRATAASSGTDTETRQGALLWKDAELSGPLQLVFILNIGKTEFCTGAGTRICAEGSSKVTSNLLPVLLGVSRRLPPAKPTWLHQSLSMGAALCLWGSLRPLCRHLLQMPTARGGVHAAHPSHNTRIQSQDSSSKSLPE